MSDSVIVAAGRTPIGRFNGTLSSCSAVELGSSVISKLLTDTGISTDTIDEVIMGQVLTAGCGQNVARQTMIRSGIADTTSAVTINKVCGSGMKAVHLASQAIRCGDANIVIAGGQESMSQSVHVLPASRCGQPAGDWQMIDSMIHDGLTDAFYHCHMGVTAENIAAQYGFSRRQQDLFAVMSQHKAEAAQVNKRFIDEIIPVHLLQSDKNIVISCDEQPRTGVTLESLAKLAPAFKKDGTVTAANSSSLNDGAAALIISSQTQAEKLNLTVMATIKACASSGVDPRIMGTGPIVATQKVLHKAGWSIDDVDLIEANEAFAVQALAVNQELGWDTEKINVNGGAIALGHPIGASGCRILVTLVHEMIKRDSKRGLATLCIGGGMGIATAIER